LIKAGNGRLWMSLAAIVADAGALFAGALLAYFLRFSHRFTEILPASNLPPFEWYLILAALFTLQTTVMLAARGFTSRLRSEGLFDEVARTTRIYVVSYTLMLAALFFYREVSFSRVTMAALFVLSLVALIVARLILRRIVAALYRRGVGVRRAAVIGSGDTVGEVVRRVQNRPDFGLAIIGSIGQTHRSVAEELSLGTIQQSAAIIREHGIDTLLIAPTSDEANSLPELIRACYGVNVEFLYIPDIEVGNAPPKRMVEVGGVPLWALKETPFTGWPGVVKRAFDLSVGFVSLVLVLPLMVLIAVCVKLTSRGPIFYRQRRVGLDGRVFDCLKFRSMRSDAESETGPVWTKEKDTRVTPLGRFLRRFSLDELPQLVNVLRGEMSLIGPRPERPEFVHQFEQQILGYHERHRVRAGMTGWAQVNGLRGEVPIEERTKYDRYYVENWSLGLDMKILLMTIRAVLFGKDSY